jgi:DNA-binding ferritin-like protein
MLEELICRTFYTRNEAHLAHWRTKSFAEHKALDEFYNGVIETIDEIVEAYQGSFGIIKELPEEEYKDMEILERLQDDAKWINKNRSKIARNVPSIENLVDELTDLYLTTIYKLKFLK